MTTPKLQPEIRVRQIASADEVASVFQTAEHRLYTKALGLRNALRAGFEPDAALLAQLHKGLWIMLLDADEVTGAQPSTPVDPRITRPTKATMRGVFKRFEEAFGRPGATPTRS